MSNETLQDKIAIVTGASRGLGTAIALRLANQGAFVIGTSTSENGAEKISQLFTDNNLSGKGMVLNVTDQVSIDDFFETLKNQEQMPDILINNAGITADNLMLRMKDQEWDDVIATNLTSIFKLSKIVLKPMMKKRWGRIVNISSVSGCAGVAGQANYAATKAGVIGFSKALAKEVATRGITVNTVAPGFIKSDMTDALKAEYQEKLLEEIPMARQGEPAEIAAAVSFLSSPGASYITGETIHVNGGLYMV